MSHWFNNIEVKNNTYSYKVDGDLIRVNVQGFLYTLDNTTKNIEFLARNGYEAI